MTQWPGYIPYHDDKLVKRYRKKGCPIISVGKRVAKSCPLTRDEIRAYVKDGAISAVKKIMDNRGLRLSESWNLLKIAMGEK